MAKPIPADLDLRNLSKDLKPEETFLDATVNKFNRGNARGSKPVQTVTPTTDDRPPPLSTESIPPLVSSTPSQLPPPSMLPPSAPTLQSVPSTIPIAAIQPMPKSSEPFKPSEESSTVSYPEKPTFVPPKPISQSPKISPSSIPNPSPSVTTTKPVPLGYANYGCYMYSVPVYSAFQPVSYPVLVQPNTTPSKSDQPTTNENVYSLAQTKDTSSVASDGKTDEKPTESLTSQELKSQTDFEEHFTPKVVPAVAEKSVCETNESIMDNKNENVSCPVPMSMALNKDSSKKGTAERFSLKTSIPISKIDMKCVTSPSEGLQSSQLRKPFNPAFHTSKTDTPKIEIQSNVLINEKSVNDVNVPVSTNSISTLITAAEVISQAETQFRKPELKSDLNTEQSTDQTFIQPHSNLPPRTIFNPINLEATKPNYSSQSQDRSHHEQKNQILLIQNKNSTNQKMLLAIQQQNPQVLLQRTSIDQKNLQAPSRPSSQSKNCKEELVNDNGTSSKVVSLKRMHQDDCDENDFENLITENQIYGNKIVVKEKSQGMQQEQEIKNKNKFEKTLQSQSKNVVLQPNFVYLSNVQFPANVMMIKNNVKINNECVKTSPNEKKQNIEVNTISNSNEAIVKSSTTKVISENKDVDILQSSNNVVHKHNNTHKTDIIFQTPNPKVIMNPQILYQVPMIIDRDNKLNQHLLNRDETKIVESNKVVQKQLENTKPNDKVFITCQMDAKLQPKILITNIRPKLTVPEEVSALDLYEKRKRLRRLKYLTNRDFKEPKKIPTSSEDNTNNIITPEKMIVEIYNEFATKKSNNEDIESGSDYEGDDIIDYNKIIEEYRPALENRQRKREFLANFRLTTFTDYKEREMDRQERIIKKDAIASAYISAGRIDCLSVENYLSDGLETNVFDRNTIPKFLEDNGVTQQRKQIFLARLKLTPVSKKNRDGYEKIWQEVIKERKRRERPSECSQTKQRKLETDNINLDTSGQLKLLTEIKKHVNENNNLIKKKMDSHSDAGDSIKVLAERNFSELNKLSKIADISVKHFSGQDCILKRDLTPGFDSENIQTATQPRPNYIHIKVPNIYKTPRVSEPTVTDTSTSEPKKAAREELLKDDGEKVRDASCQASSNSWQNVEALIRSYKEYDAARKKEISELNRRNTTLRVESAYVTRNASRDSDRAKALLAERKNLAQEEATVRQSIQKIYTALEVIKNCQIDKLHQPS